MGLTYEKLKSCFKHKKGHFGPKKGNFGPKKGCFWHINGHLECKMAKQYLQPHMNIHMTGFEPKKGHFLLKWQFLAIFRPKTFKQQTF